jgi:DNA-binding response OmpR family regulator
MPDIKVLIVEDDAVIGMFMEQLLEDSGFPGATHAQTITEALSEARGGYGLAFLDINLQEGTTEAVADALLAAGTPFIITSGADRPAWHPDAPMLHKPFGLKELELAIASVGLRR